MMCDMNMCTNFAFHVTQFILPKYFVNTQNYHSYYSKLNAFSVKTNFQPSFQNAVMQVVPLHQYPDYVEQCCDLINSEWKRSKTARMRSLEGSSDRLPTNLIMLHDGAVIGHSKLSPVPSIQSACFLESVIVDKTLRGKGYGKYLMKKVEDYCRSLGLKTIFLSTKDKALFYTKLGYVLCEPVSIYGQYVKSMSASSSTDQSTLKSSEVTDKSSLKSTPPPPPLPPDLYIGRNCDHKVFMSKVLN